MVPVYNELAVLPALWARLVRLRTQRLARHRVHVVFVDDGSTDGSAAWLARLAHRAPQVMLVQLAGGFGHQQALCAGLDYAPGDVVVTLDADLQDPPEYIETMLALWQAGADVVYGVRLSRHGDSAVKRLCAASFYRLLSVVCGHTIPKDCGDFRLFDRQVVRAVQRLPRQRPYVRGMVASVGFAQVALPYRRAARWAGVTGYAWPKMLKLAWAGLVSFAQPARVSLVFASVWLTILLAAEMQQLRIGFVWQGAGFIMCLAAGVRLAVLQRGYAALSPSPPCYRVACTVGHRAVASNTGADYLARTHDAQPLPAALGCQD